MLKGCNFNAPQALNPALVLSLVCFIALTMEQFLMKPDPGAPLNASKIAPPRALGASKIAPLLTWVHHKLHPLGVWEHQQLHLIRVWEHFLLNLTSK